MAALSKWVAQNELYIILAIATFFSYYWLSQNKKKLNIRDGTAFLLAVLHTLTGLACVKLFAFLEGGADAQTAGNMSLYGAVFFLPAVYFAAARLTKRDAANVFDVFTICVIFTLFCARINCLLGGCCLGKVIGNTDVRWPTREAEMVFYVILLIWLGRKSEDPKSKGKLYPLYMIAYGSFRFVEEWFRETSHPVGYLHISHIWSIVAVVIGVAVYRNLEKKQASGKNSRRVRKTRMKKEEER